MTTAIELTDAAIALREQFGPRFEASHQGGRQRLVAALCRQFAIEAGEAERLATSLERHKAIIWQPASGIARPCPGVLELFGDWLIQPEHVRVGEQESGRGLVNVAARAEQGSSAATMR